MNVGTISKAILARIQADTGTGGLYNGGGYKIITDANYNTKGPGASDAPWLTWTINAKADNAMRGMGARALIVFTIVDKIINGTDNIESVFYRLLGDAMLATATNGVPSYGFHNHILDLGTNTLGMTASEVTWDEQDLTAIDENYQHGVLTCFVNTSNQQVT